MKFTPAIIYISILYFYSMKNVFPLYRPFRHAIRSSFVFATSNCYWPKKIMWFILTDNSYCWQKKQMNIEVHIWRVYSTVPRLYTENLFRYLIESNRNHIVFTISRLIWNQTDLRFVPNQLIKWWIQCDFDFIL